MCVHGTERERERGEREGREERERRERRERKERERERGGGTRYEMKSEMPLQNMTTEATNNLITVTLIQDVGDRVAK